MYFGPAGNSDSFAAMGYKSSAQVPEYLEKMGLNAYEYQCGRGVRVSSELSNMLRNAARDKNIRLSIHAPYYISLSSEEADKRDKSIVYIMETARAANAMGATRIVVHSGSCGKMKRDEALELAKGTMSRAIAAMEGENLGHIHICPEVMGKHNQLGTLDEVLALCGLDERMIPCIDFGHYNSRTGGGLKTAADFDVIFDAVENALGNERMRKIHAHFSKIEYTEKGGEVRHLTFADEQYGPEFAPLAEVLARRGIEATIICESSGTQAEDAAEMRRMFLQAKGV